ncbi:uncharacterized protein G2W53_009625 [Senna tora]|uniref:Uncharacterized protein n=1 Tax=Senna tora TaxID=362788 RepID=A0A835CAD2_9FABA|nr:uncharacterized protein G2W53_009625 [Senna tora]
MAPHLLTGFSRNVRNWDDEFIYISLVRGSHPFYLRESDRQSLFPIVWSSYRMALVIGESDLSDIDRDVVARLISVLVLMLRFGHRDFVGPTNVKEEPNSPLCSPLGQLGFTCTNGDERRQQVSPV